MKKLNGLIVLLLLVILCRCNLNKDESTESRISVLPAEFTKDEFSLNDIFNDLIIVPLSSDIPLPQIYKIQCFDSTFYFLDQNLSKIYRFTFEGRFIDVLEKQGRGPEEYLSIQDFHVSREGEVFINSIGNRKVLVYSSDYNYLRSIPYPKEIYAADVSWLDSVMIFFPRGAGTAVNLDWVITNLEGDIIETKLDNNDIRTYAYFGSKDLFTFGNDSIVYRYRSCSDTIFGIISSGYFPIYVYNRIFSDGLRMTSLDELFPETLTATHLLELANHAGKRDIRKIYDIGNKLIIAFWGEKSETVLFDPNTNEARIILDNNKGSSRIPDDWLNTGPIIIRGTTTVGSNQYIVAYHEATKLKSFLTDDDFLYGMTTWPEKKKEFQELAITIKEDDNPVLLLFRYK